MGMQQKELAWGVETTNLSFRSILCDWCIASFPTEVFPAAQGRFHQRKPVLELHHDPDCFKSVLQPINYNENRGLSILSLVLWRVVITPGL